MPAGHVNKLDGLLSVSSSPLSVLSLLSLLPAAVGVAAAAGLSDALDKCNRLGNLFRSDLRLWLTRCAKRLCNPCLKRKVRSSCFFFCARSPVHRLDALTGGLVVLAKTAGAMRET